MHNGSVVPFLRPNYAGTGKREGHPIMNTFETGNAVRASDRPVVTSARLQLPIDLQKILAPTDLTPDGRKAVEYALALAKCFCAQLTLLHVYDAPSLYD